MKLTIAVRTRNEIEVIPWLLANTKYADTVVISDHHSDDGTWQYLQRAAGDDQRIALLPWNKNSPPFVAEDQHISYLFDFCRSIGTDWLQFLDADEIPNITLQTQIKGWLGMKKASPKTGISINFFYLAPGWVSYYREFSRWPLTRLWNYVPKVSPDPNAYKLELPTTYIEAPSEMSISHFNWALEERFERKRRLYELRFNAVSWHPDDKHPDKEPLVADHRHWRSPEGKIISCGEMVKWFPSSR